MYIFLSRVGRFVTATITVAAVLSIFGLNSPSIVPVASKHPAVTAATCTVSASAVGSVLTIAGTGYAANTTYLVDIKWPAGNTSAQSALANGSGDLNAWTYAYYPGAYSVAVFTIGSHPSQVASCSTSVS